MPCSLTSLQKRFVGIDNSLLRAIATFPLVRDIRVRLLGRFADHFRCNIATIQPEDLRAYLGTMKVGPVAKNNHRQLIVTLFSFARGEGWLHADQKTAAERLGAYKVKERDVEIFTPSEVARLLAHAEEDFLPWIALIAFGGVRNEELNKGLIWEAINFNRGYLIIPASIAKTSRKRKIDLPEIVCSGSRPTATGVPK